MPSALGHYTVSPVLSAEQLETCSQLNPQVFFYILKSISRSNDSDTVFARLIFPCVKFYIVLTLTD